MTASPPTLADVCGCGLAGTCRPCVLAAADPDYARLWGRAPARRPPCVHLGGVIEPCPNRDEGRHVHECDVFDRCTLAACGKTPAVCGTCAHYRADPTLSPARANGAAVAALPPHPDGWRWVSTADLIRDAIALAGVLPADCSGVVGIPRSGLIPASVIATHLHLPLHTFASGRLVRCEVGWSRGGAVGGRGGPLAVIDDTVFAGSAMRRARDAMAAAGERAVFCAVYANSLRPESRDALDFYGRELPAPHLLEWNWANNGPFAGAWTDVPEYGAGMALDLDGVIVHDEFSGGKMGTPYMVPRAHPCRLIATGRAERFRAGTEAMLRAIGVRWERLEMLPDHIPLTAENAARHKAGHFLSSACGVFVESCPEQAATIHRLTGKRVVCPRAGVVTGGQR